MITQLIAVYLILGLMLALISLSMQWHPPESATFRARCFALLLFGWGLVLMAMTIDFILLVIFGTKYENYSRKKMEPTMMKWVNDILVRKRDQRGKGCPNCDTAVLDITFGNGIILDILNCPYCKFQCPRFLTKREFLALCSAKNTNTLS